MRERVRKDWPWAFYYGGLVKALPGLVLNASNAVGNFVGALIVLLAVAGVSASFLVLVQWRWQIGVVVGLIVLGALAKANYLEVAKRDARIADLERERFVSLQQEIADVMKTAKGHMQEAAFDAVMKAVDKGRDEVWGPLRLDTPTDEGEWTGKVDAWETETIAMLEKWWGEAEVALYKRDTGLIRQIEDWRTRLVTFMEVKMKRLLDIAKGPNTRYKDGS